MVEHTTVRVQLKIAHLVPYYFLCMYVLAMFNCSAQLQFCHKKYRAGKAHT